MSAGLQVRTAPGWFHQHEFHAGLLHEEEALS